MIRALALCLPLCSAANGAQIVVVASDAGDPASPGRAQKGQIVAVFEDDVADLGRAVAIPPEKGGRFVVLRFAGKASDLLKAYPDLTSAYMDAEGNLVSKRLWKFGDAALKPEEKAAMSKDGVVALTADAVKAATVNAATGKTLATTAAVEAPKEGEVVK